MISKDVKPIRYIPSFLKSYLDNARSISANLDISKDTNFENTSSFIYDLPNVGLKSTQQINVDWSKFENHTFFNSAEVNVNIAFDKIINTFPFDGTKKEYEIFFEGLSGFEKWVYDNFPKNTGYLKFDNNPYIEIKDYAGGLFPDISKNKSGTPILDPLGKSITVEFHLFIPSGSSSDQIIFRRLNASGYGIICYLESSLVNSGICQLVTVIKSSSENYLDLRFPVEKGKFNHVCIVHNRDASPNILEAYVNVESYYKTQKSLDVGAIDYAGTQFYIGGVPGQIAANPSRSFTYGSTTENDLNNLSGSIDEFRIFHSARSYDQIKSYAKKSVYSNDDLKLYYKFNEPNGFLVDDEDSIINKMVLDSSGNSLHSIIKFDITPAQSILDLRSVDSDATPITNEKLYLCPVLFTSFDSVKEQNESLLSEANLYDQENPNLITKLVPQHYLLEGQHADGFSSFNGDINSKYASNVYLQNGKLGSTQIMLSFLYIWAKFFDDLKLYVDAFSKVHFVDYDKNETTPDNFLRLAFKHLGFKEPQIFFGSEIGQYIGSEDVLDEYGNSELSLKSIENELFRRTLSSMGNIIKSKGTQRSIKSFLRTVGIDPDNSLRIREFGGPDEKQLTNSREQKIDYSTMLKMEAGEYFRTNILSASRSEPGSPTYAGAIISGSSNDVNDSLLTSGSWTYEAIYKFSPSDSISTNYQSLARIETSGSNITLGGMLFNLIASRSLEDDEESYIKLYGRPGTATNLTDSPILFMSLPINIFDGEKWYISFGRKRKDQINAQSSSYFLRAAKSSSELYETTKFFEEKTSTSGIENAIQKYVAILSEGPFIQVGSEAQVLPNMTNILTYYIASYEQDGSLKSDIYGDYFYVKYATDGDFIHVIPKIKFFYNQLDPNNNACIVPAIPHTSTDPATNTYVWESAIKISDMTSLAGTNIWNGTKDITLNTINVNPTEQSDYIVGNSEKSITLLNNLSFNDGYTISLENGQIIEFFGSISAQLYEVLYEDSCIKVRFKKQSDTGAQLLTNSPMKVVATRNGTSTDYAEFESGISTNVYVEWKAKNSHLNAGQYSIQVHTQYGDMINYGSIITSLGAPEESRYAVSYDISSDKKKRDKRKKDIEKNDDLQLGYVDANSQDNEEDIILGQGAVDTKTFLSDVDVVSEVTYPGCRSRYFEGMISNLRFWSKALTKEEFVEHVRNPRSVGVLDPTTNFNFEKNKSGSFERLRVDITMKESTKKIPNGSGEITFFDYSQNNFHGSGYGFSETGETPFVVELFNVDYISPNFDEASTNSKVRIRSYKNFEKVENSSIAQIAPVYYINPSERPMDDARFSIEYSLVDALNRDIINIFATLDSIDNAIGNPELLFSQDYPKLDNLREIYFNRLTDKINFKSFFEFFRWFENSIVNFIDQLIPRKTKYLGTNFVIESHMLERSKVEYLYNDIYLGESSRARMRDSILLQQIVGSMKKF